MTSNEYALMTCCTVHPSGPSDGPYDGMLEIIKVTKIELKDRAFIHQLHDDRF